MSPVVVEQLLAAVRGSCSVPDRSTYGPVTSRERPTAMLYVESVPWQQESRDTNR